jgi:mono/diheme cytochrome c family protein
LEGDRSVKTFLLGFIAALIVLPIACMAYFALGFSPIQADAKPSALETAILQSAVRASVRRSASRILNPQAADDAVVAGGKLYVLGCQGCHGDLGGAYKEDRDNFPPVPELPHTGTQYSEPEIYWIVKHGVRMTGMSAYGPFYSEKQLWSLSAFLHHINKLPPATVEKILAKKTGSS